MLEKEPPGDNQSESEAEDSSFDSKAIGEERSIVEMGKENSPEDTKISGEFNINEGDKKIEDEEEIIESHGCLEDILAINYHNERHESEECRDVKDDSIFCSMKVIQHTFNPSYKNDDIFFVCKSLKG